MKLWDCFLQQMDKQFGKGTVDRWLRSITVKSFDAANLHLEAKDSFQVMWFEEHVRPVLKRSFLNNNGRPIKVHLQVKNALAPKTPTPRATQTLEKISYDSDELLEYCSFEQYEVIPDNTVPFKVLCNLTGYDLNKKRIGKPSIDPSMYNPVFLYGPPGTGKTHLLMAAAHTFRERGLKTIFVHAQTFTDHVVSAIRRGDMQAFRNTYRHVDVLIIDDIQVLARKNATQEELFHTFNTLHTASKFILLGSNIAPNFLEGIEERLISRFEWGITLPIQKTAQKTALVQIIRKRASFYHLNMEKGLEEYLAVLFNDAKSILKALDALVVHAQLEGLPSPIRLATVKDFIDSILEKTKTYKLTPDKILQMVADLFGIKIDDITGKSQSRECALPRQIAMYLLRSELRMPYMKIGKVFSRDHSTVMSSIKIITNNLEKKDREITFYLQDIQRKLLSCG